MSSINLLGRSIKLATCSVMILSDTQANARIVHIPEICMRVTVPDNRSICPDLSPTFHYVHGLYFELDARRDCKADGPKINRIGVWEDANSGDETLKDYIKIECGHSRMPIKRNGLRLSGMRSISCIYPDRPFGLRVNLVGYAGSWDKKPDQPAIFYKVWMITQRDRLRRDMVTFETFVREAKIEDGRCRAELSS